MGFMDSVTNAFDKLKSSGSRPSAPLSLGGIGNPRQGIVSFEDDMIVSKPAIVFYISQVFFNFLAMACMASVASFQAKWNVGPSGLSGFAVFVSVSGIVLSLLLLLSPVVYEKFDKGARLARALREVRVGFILIGSGTVVSLLIAFILTISAWTQPGCKDASKDPHAGDRDDGFKNGLPNWCNTKKAAAIFFWLAFVFWACSFGLTVMDWRSAKASRPRDPPFEHPTDDIEYEEDGAEEESNYHQPTNPRRSTYDDGPYSDSNRYSPPNAVPPSLPPMSFSTSPPPVPQPGGFASPTNPRPSMDVYGAFSDPAPTGYVAGVPSSQAQQSDPRMSRTMQYADPYAAVRATISPASGQPQPVDRRSSAPPPSYSFEGRY